MDLSGACPAYQTDKQYTVQINSSSVVFSSYIQNNCEIYMRRKVSLTFQYNQPIQLLFQYFSKLGFIQHTPHKAQSISQPVAPAYASHSKNSEICPSN
jgi:hypothetical protein